jgi:predicted ABC-type ATPase
VIGGPNGAGKSTTARLLLANLEVQEFINADTIARGLAAGEPAGQALAAGRILLERMREYTRRGLDFAFETTMASSRMGAWIRTFQARGYRVHALYLWLPSPELALERVRSRVRAGGHDVPEDTVRRRYRRGLNQFLHPTRGRVDNWVLFDNGDLVGPRPVASGGLDLKGGIHDDETWRRVLASQRS